MSDTISFTPPGIRTRRDRQQPNGDRAPVALVPADDEVEEAALRFSTLAGNIKKDRDAMREERDSYRARLEQSELTNSTLRSEMASLREMVDEAKRKTEQARAEQVRLETVIAGMVNMGQDALPQ